jgi:hypothetical protein
MVKRRGTNKGFVGHPGGKRPHGRSGRPGDNIKINLQVVGWGGGEWFDLDQNTGRWWAVVNVVINIRVL